MCSQSKATLFEFCLYNKFFLRKFEFSVWELFEFYVWEMFDFLCADVEFSLLLLRELEYFAVVCRGNWKERKEREEDGIKDLLYA